MPHSETEILKKLMGRVSNGLTDNWIPPSISETDILKSLQRTHRLSSISNHSGN